MCHFKKNSESEERSNKNNITKKIAEMSKHVDKFHFRNHVDKWCQENCNPDKVGALKGVNTQVCEQLFKKLNSHKNCKSLNEACFFLFFLYNIDLHNLSIEGMSIKADPRNAFRWNNIKFKDVDWNEVEKSEAESNKSNKDVLIDDLTSYIKSLSVQTKEFTCHLCNNSYSKQGFLDSHMEQKHDLSHSFGEGNICEVCKKPQSDRRAMKRHMETHMKCTKCKLKFNTVLESEEHKKTHRYCNTCEKDFEIPSKLTKHMKTVHML